MIGRPAEILRHLEPGAATDAELLARFLRRDEDAFPLLVRRHGPTILAVCRRITRHNQDAEDAFQAAFLVLAKKAAAIRDPQRLGNWLYGVAVRVSRRARHAALRRRAREVPSVNVPEPPARGSEPDSELGAILHEELAKLPALYREAILLCDLRGATRAEAAKALGIAEGTLSSRLAAGRQKLAERLSRRGVALAASAIPAALADGASAALPDSLLAKTCTLVAGWQAGATIPAAVLRLTRGGFSMRLTILAGAMTAAFAATGLVMASLPQDSPPSDPPKPQAAAKATPVAAAPETVGPRFTTEPRLSHAVDFPIKDVEGIVWSQAGDAVALQGWKEKVRTVGANRQQYGGPEAIIYRIGDKKTLFSEIQPGAPFALLGFTSNGKEVITAFNEDDLISGRHQLQYWKLTHGAYAELQLDRSVDLRVEHLQNYAFAANGKSFRTSSNVSPQSDGGCPIQVREISTETGKTVRTVLKTKEPYEYYQLAANGKRLAAVDAEGGIDVWDLGTGMKESTPRTRADVKSFLKDRPASNKKDGGVPWTLLQFSPDSRLLLIVDFQGARIYDTEKREFTPKLEGSSLLRPSMDVVSISTNNQLLAINASYGPDSNQEPPGLSIWDLKTGKLLKQWGRSATFAWSPTAPVLAILEANGQNTRLGLWDFAAE
ncbi:MAG TPA: sigma-70 family RNA polymerase sigma factor [Urbifossiella sp.]|nr:sigma-70 family RNA polymerase sigma factor [Urbifossiella sp.]